MLNAKGKVIYVGKAVNLRTRIRQYFMEKGGDSRLSIVFIREALDRINTIITTSEKEAFLLENTLIKRHKPDYNVRLRDDKTYVSVRIDLAEEWPRPEIIRQRNKDKALYFGPYISAQALRETLRSLQQVFPLRGCKGERFRNRTRPCLLYQIGLCSGVCAGKVTQDEYRENLRGVIAFLKGKNRDVADIIRRKMQEHSDRMEYEKAGRLRDQLAALEAVLEKQRVAAQGQANSDVIGYQEERGQAAIALLFFRDGQLVESSKWVIPVYGEEKKKSLAGFLGQYYGEGRLIPPEILAPFEPQDKSVIEEWLSELRGASIRIRIPRKGEKLRLTEMANANALEALQRKLSGQEETRRVLEDLAKRLSLRKPPSLIECYDIATLQGASSVGAKVAFREAEPAKNEYRLFKIKGVKGQDDFAMIREVLARRFRTEGQDPQSLPDLLVVDGGKGQLAMAEEVIGEMQLQGIALAALVKSHLKSDDSGESARTAEHIFLPGRKNPVLFPPYAPSFYLLQRLRDEAHRFANSFHAKNRKSKTLRSSLREIEGIGDRRAKALLRHFGSLARIREASIENLAAAPLMNRGAAQKVYEFCRSEPDSPPAEIHQPEKV